MQFFKSQFLSNNLAFEAFFSQDSLFSKHFFNDDFIGSNFENHFMDIDKLKQQIIEKQNTFLEKYQSEFIKPEDEN